MTKYSRGQQAQINKRIRLRGGHDFTVNDRKCILCGHRFDVCMHTVDENQEALKIFASTA